jgi:hypothetical protein
MALSSKDIGGSADNGERGDDLIDQHVKDNYLQLIEEGRSPESLAATAEAMEDKNLAAWLRKQSSGKRSAVPQDRKAPGGKSNG